MKTKTKKQMVEFFTDEISDCGSNNYYGYKMADNNFSKQLMKMSKSEIENLLNNYSNSTQSFIQ